MSSKVTLEARFETLRNWHGHLGFKIGNLVGIQSRHDIESEQIPEVFDAIELHADEVREAKLLALQARDDQDREGSNTAMQNGVTAVIALLDKLQAQKDSGFGEAASLDDEGRSALSGWVDAMEEAYGWIREAEIEQ